MNAVEERQLRSWLAERDPGDAPSRLRAAAVDVAGSLRPRAGLFDYVPIRVLGRSSMVRPFVALLVMLAVLASAIGAGLLWRWLQFPPRGLIAYTVALEQTGSSGIRLIAADGTGGLQITQATPNLYEHAPRWSPDGRKLAFARLAQLDAFGSCPGVGSIVLYDVATEREQVVADGLGTIQDVAWSPSGRKLAFVGPNSGCAEVGDLGVIDASTGTVTHTPLANGTWSLRWQGETVTAVAVAPLNPLPTDPTSREVLSGDARFVARVPVPGRPLDVSLTVGDQATGFSVDLGAGGSPTWAHDDASLAFIQFTKAPAEYDIAFRDRLAIAEVGTWRVRTIADVMVIDDQGAPSLVRVPRLAWTEDGQAVYWMDAEGGHIAELATGRVVDLPAAVKGCDDLQWQPIPR